MIKFLVFMGLSQIALAQWPCPLANDIKPCICHMDSNNDLFLDCSEIQSDAELEGITSTVFPFPDFKKLTINQENPENSIITLQYHTLGELYFQNIQITGTLLENVKEQAFAKSHDSLITLELNRNRMTDFAIEAISNFKSLRKLDLSDNRLINLPTLTSDSLSQFLAGKNPELKIYANTFAECPNLGYVNLNEISLQTVPQGLFNALVEPAEIHLAGNFLSDLDDESVTPIGNTIHRLDFADNQIYNIRSGAISGLQGPNAEVVFKNNQIRNLDQEIWEPIFLAATKPNSIDLSGNDLACGCVIKWIVNNATYWGSVTDDTNCDTGDAFNSISADIINQIC